MEEAEIGMGMWEELKAILDCLGEEVGEDNRERERSASTINSWQYLLLTRCHRVPTMSQPQRAFSTQNKFLCSKNHEYLYITVWRKHMKNIQQTSGAQKGRKGTLTSWVTWPNGLPPPSAAGTHKG